MPTWMDIKNKMIEACKKEGKMSEEDYRRCQSSDPYDCMQFIYDSSKSIYEDVLRTNIDTSLANMALAKKLIRNLKSLNPVAIVTTNFDDLLKQSGVFKNEDFRYRADCSPQELRDGKVFCIHGDPTSMFFKYSDRTLYQDPLFQSFIYNVFGSYFVLFLGYSFQDEQLRNCLAISDYFKRLGRRTHFALTHSLKKEIEFHLEKICAMSLRSYSVYEKDSDLVNSILSWGETTLKDESEENLGNLP
jgi:UDP-2,3-diacylglucosamine pyrophosphatase LpxH